MYLTDSYCGTEAKPESLPREATKAGKGVAEHGALDYKECIAAT